MYCGGSVPGARASARAPDGHRRGGDQQDDDGADDEPMMRPAAGNRLAVLVEQPR